MAKVYLLLGGNLGDKIFFLEQASELIAKHIGSVIQKSSFYESDAWGFESNDSFINQVLLINTILSPDLLLEKIKSIEKSLGRVRGNVGYVSRTIDIDILFYDDIIVETEDLSIPHKFLHERMFTLAPLKEIASDFIHPQKKQTIHQLHEICKDEVFVAKLN